jgi:REP element-mobilizing transposase RayT
VLAAHGQREAFWTAAALRRFLITLSNFGFTCESSKGIFRLMPEAKTPWPHAPIHQLAALGTYIVTGSTHKKAHFFRGAERLQVLQRGLLSVAGQFDWQLEAWAVFSNHYHFVAHSPGDALDASSLSAMLSVLHVKTAAWINKLDHQSGRPGMVQLLGHAANPSEVVFGSVKLRPPKRGEARSGGSGAPVSVVFSGVV